MNALGRIFGRQGVKVINTDRLGFSGDRLPDEGELCRVIGEYRRRLHDDLAEAMEKSKPGIKLNIITTSNMNGKAAKGPKVQDIAEPEPEPEAKPSLRELWRRLKKQVDENEQK